MYSNTGERMARNLRTWRRSFVTQARMAGPARSSERRPRTGVSRAVSCVLDGRDIGADGVGILEM
ncbi:hypothetical protein BDP67DRAFT_499837 [Colletotrichum lupini]|nr:hypothetical protein BDP67DRAFT_499837 [Colletotrichum lupini]